MGYAEKLVYCKNKKDTKEFFKMLRLADNDYCEIVAKSITNQTWDAEWRNLKGLNIFGIEMPFTFTTDFEVEHSEAFYISPEMRNLQQKIGKRYQRARNKQIQPEPVYDTPQHKTFQPGELFIHMAGNRGNMKDGYAMLGIDDLALEGLYNAYTKNLLEDQYLKDGKINLDVAMPWLCDLLATELYGEDGARIIREVQIIDIDGLEDPDYVLNEFFAHNYLR